MTTDLAIIKPYEINTDLDQYDIDHLIKTNESLESEVRRLRKDKDHLIEQMSLLKKFSDGLWEKLRMDI